MSEQLSSSTDRREMRAALTKLLADLDLLFTISYFDRKTDERTWSLMFEIGEDRSVTVQLAFFEGYLSVFNAVELQSDPPPEVLQGLLRLNGAGPVGSCSATERSILMSANIPLTHLDLELLKGAIGGVLRVAGDVRKLLADTSTAFHEMTRS